MTNTLETLATAAGGTVTTDYHDVDCVRLSYGPLGFLTLYPDTITRGSLEEFPAARIEGSLRRRNGGLQATLRARLRAAGIEIR